MCGGGETWGALLRSRVPDRLPLLTSSLGAVRAEETLGPVWFLGTSACIQALGSGPGRARVTPGRLRARVQSSVASPTWSGCLLSGWHITSWGQGLQNMRCESGGCGYDQGQLTKVTHSRRHPEFSVQAVRSGSTVHPLPPLNLGGRPGLGLPTASSPGPPQAGPVPLTRSPTPGGADPEKAGPGSERLGDLLRVPQHRFLRVGERLSIGVHRWPGRWRP